MEDEMGETCSIKQGD